MTDDSSRVSTHESCQSAHDEYQYVSLGYGTDTEAVVLSGTGSLHVVAGSVSVCGYKLHAKDSISLSSIPSAGACIRVEPAKDERAGVMLALRPSELSASPTALLTPDAWVSATHSVVASTNSAAQCACVVGGTGVGKSSVCRMLMNRLLQSGNDRVALLDVDPGQPMLHTPGSISLRICAAPVLSQPAHTLHSLEEPLMTEFVGSLSPKYDVQLYNQAVARLVQAYYNKLYPESIPIVVNTMGWVKGIGFGCLCALLSQLRLTYVLELIRSGDEQSELPSGAFWLDQDVDPASQLGVNVLKLPGLTGQKDSAEHRGLMWQRWVNRTQHAMLNEGCKHVDPLGVLQPSSNAYSSFARALCSMPTYCIELSQVDVHMIGFDSSLPKSETIRAALAKPVGLFTSGWSCIGIGILRSLHAFHSGTNLHLIAPITSFAMCSVTQLLVGQLEVSHALLRPGDGLNSPYVSHFGVQGYGTGAKTKRKRTNFQRA